MFSSGLSHVTGLVRVVDPLTKLVLVDELSPDDRLHFGPESKVMLIFGSDRPHESDPKHHRTVIFGDLNCATGEYDLVGIGVTAGDPMGPPPLGNFVWHEDEGGLCWDGWGEDHMLHRHAGIKSKMVLRAYDKPVGLLIPTDNPRLFAVLLALGLTYGQYGADEMKVRWESLLTS